MSGLALTPQLTSPSPAETLKRNPIRLIDWIWRIRGSVEIPSERDAFDDIAPLLAERGTTVDREGDTVWFRKRDPDAQDKLSIIDRGTLKIEHQAGTRVLRYDLKSPTLLFCFFLPLLFIAFGQLNLAIGKWEKASEAAEAKANPGADKDKGKDAKKDKVLPQNPIDQWLGAPKPEMPKKDKKKEDDGRTATKAYVFASFFAILFVIGQFLERWLIKRAFRQKLAGES